MPTLSFTEFNPASPAGIGSTSPNTGDFTNVSATGKYAITGSGSVPTAAAIEIGTNGSGSRLICNVPTGGEHNLNVNGVTSFYATGSGVGYTGTLTGGAGAINIGGGQLVKDADGNLGIGVTPSAWAYRAIDVRTAALYDGVPGTASGITFNAIFNGTDWVYKGTGGNATAMRYHMESGQHQWFTAPTGAAGGAISFTRVMTLDAAANLDVAGPFFSLGTNRSAWGSGRAFEFGPSANGFLFNDSNNVNLGANAYFNSGWNYQASAVGASRYTQSSGSHIWFTAPSGTAGNPISFTPAMILEATGRLGIGVTSPTAPLQIQAASGSPWLLSKNGTDELYVGVNASLSIPSIESNTAIRFATGASYNESARIDSSGNMAIGITPSPWAGTNARGLEVGVFASLSSSNTYGTGLGFNTYHNGTNYVRRTANVASFLQCDGTFRFRIGATGAAGSTITFTEAMTINASSNVGIGVASPTQRLDVNGTVKQTGVMVATSAKTAAYTANGNDYVIRCNATTAAFTVTLPAAASNTGRAYVIKKTDNSANAVTIDANASELIDGSLTVALTTLNQVVRICCNGTGWDVI
jgi:hypothetical protein